VQPAKQVPLVKREQPAPRVSLVPQVLQVKRAPLALRAQPDQLEQWALLVQSELPVLQVRLDLQGPRVPPVKPERSVLQAQPVPRVPLAQQVKPDLQEPLAPRVPLVP
jgi:hypothetical protein